MLFFYRQCLVLEVREPVGWLLTSHWEKDKDNEKKKAVRVG